MPFVKTVVLARNGLTFICGYIGPGANRITRIGRRKNCFRVSFKKGGEMPILNPPKKKPAKKKKAAPEEDNPEEKPEGEKKETPGNENE